ncbi:hypothetical protein PoB_006735000 [Plakobranchus ocellatus]|uniref:Vesicular, overexpressed in cancer, prosurvival protein 1 n=1 Tax=Plakobranchus ocellatus TaxID=259542 RepID=A0AAV4DA58_9GAST|nr:hypothetical protein PoB_006735000 [Plakobranchus ocellatus]
MELVGCDCEVCFWTILSFSIKRVLLLSAIIFSKDAVNACSDKKHRKEDEDDEEECWYQLWYFWLIIALFLAGVLLLVFIYCKQHAKQARLEGLGRTGTQMVLPPSYDEPGHLPPPYSAALPVTDTPQPAHFQHQCQIYSLRSQAPNAPALINHIRAESVPPPYSPPPNDAQHDLIQTPSNNMLESNNASPLPSWSISPQSEVAGVCHISTPRHAAPTVINQPNDSIIRSSAAFQNPPCYLPVVVPFSHSQNNMQDSHPLTTYMFYHNPMQTSPFQLSSNDPSPCYNASIYTISQPQLQFHSHENSVPNNMVEGIGYGPNSRDSMTNNFDRADSSAPPSTNQAQQSRNITAFRRQTRSQPALATNGFNLRLMLTTNPSHHDLSHEPIHSQSNPSAFHDNNRLLTSHSYNMAESTTDSSQLSRFQGRSVSTTARTENTPVVVFRNESITNSVITNGSTSATYRTPTVRGSLMETDSQPSRTSPLKNGESRTIVSPKNTETDSHSPVPLSQMAVSTRARQGGGDDNVPYRNERLATTNTRQIHQQTDQEGQNGLSASYCIL